MMRSTGRGGPTAEEMADFHEEGITTERKIKRGDYGKKGMAPMEPMPPASAASKPMPKPVKKATGGSIDGCAQRGKTKGTMR